MAMICLVSILGGFADLDIVFFMLILSLTCHLSDMRLINKKILPRAPSFGLGSNNSIWVFFVLVENNHVLLVPEVSE